MKLTRRELQVLRGIASDKAGKSIAHDLGMAFKTFDNHRTNLMNKLNIHTAVGLTHWALSKKCCFLLVLIMGQGRKD